MVRLLFQVVELLGECIVVLDEVDGLFRERNNDEHEVSRTIKTEFLQLWQGVSTNNNHVTFLGATNRPFDVDPAVLRRLPQSFFVGLPPLEDRRSLLMIWCHEHELPIHPQTMEEIAQVTHLYSPSDMFNLLLEASKLGPIQRGDMNLTIEDVRAAMTSVPASKFSPSYVQKLHHFMGGPGNQSQQHQTGNYQPGQEPQVGKWETPMGNFYHVGHVAADEGTAKAFHDILHPSGQDDFNKVYNSEDNEAFSEEFTSDIDDDDYDDDSDTDDDDSEL